MNPQEYRPFSSVHIAGYAQGNSSNLPLNLTLHETGFPTDGENLYMVRRSVIDNVAIDSEVTSLPNGQLKREGRLPIFQATEGHGMYVANHPQATNVFGIEGMTMYTLRIPLANTEILNTDDLTTAQTSGQKTASLLHRARGDMIGVPNPGTRAWDALYGTADVVTFRPMALARLMIGHTVSIGDQKAPPRWAVLRNDLPATVVAKGSWRTS